MALRAARLTAGDVDPTVGQALISLGYDRDFGSLAGVGVRVQGEGARSPGTRTLASIPGWRTVTVDSERSTVTRRRAASSSTSAPPRRRSPPTGRRQRHCAAAGCGVLVSLGGDLAIAGPAPAAGWRIRVTDDHRSGFDAPGQWISLSSGGLATSSTAVRRWRTAARHRASPGRSAHRATPPTASGGRSACPPAVAWTRTSRAPRRSSGARRPRPGSRRSGCRAGSCEPTGPFAMSAAGRPKATISQLP